ncbi:MAG TPA: ABC transporter permease [Anaerolineales bacterium]|nr:ABC transporter permease [Anaerolineales bacterium]
MKKIGLVALHEYRRHVFNRRFIFGLLSVPLVIILLVGLVFLIISMDNNTTPIGYVDHSGLLSNPVPVPKAEPPYKPVPFVAFDTEEAARAALDAGKLQAYYVLPADYLTTGELRVVHAVQIKDPARVQFYNFLGANLLKNTDPVIATRLVKGADLTVQSADGTRSLSSNSWFSFLVPMIAGIGFIIAMFTSGGYLMQAVVEEKENRTMEVIVTSVTPNELMAGKILGDTAIGLTQILLWILFIVIPILVGRSSLKFLQGIQVSTQTLVVMLAVMLPSFVLVAALMATIGATVSEAREGQQMTGLISLPIWIPYMLFGLLMSNPNSPIALVLGMLPLTAPVTMLVRDGLTILPAWQIAVSSAIQVLFAIGGIWLAGRAFRLGMLRYGKRLAWRELFVRSKPA